MLALNLLNKSLCIVKIACASVHIIDIKIKYLNRTWWPTKYFVQPIMQGIKNIPTHWGGSKHSISFVHLSIQDKISLKLEEWVLPTKKQ